MAACQHRRSHLLLLHAATSPPPLPPPPTVVGAVGGLPSDCLVAMAVDPPSPPTVEGACTPSSWQVPWGVHQQQRQYGGTSASSHHTPRHPNHQSPPQMPPPTVAALVVAVDSILLPPQPVSANHDTCPPATAPTWRGVSIRTLHRQTQAIRVISTLPHHHRLPS